MENQTDQTDQTDQTPNTKSLKDQLRLIIFGSNTPAGKRFDVVLLWFIAGSITVVMLESVGSIRDEHLTLLTGLEWFFTIAFTIEYALRIWTSADRKRYIFSFFGLVDLLSILPTYLTLIPGLEDAHFAIVLRILRLLRMFRVLKMARHLSEAHSILRALKASVAKITVFLFAVVSLAMIMGTAMYLIEGQKERLHLDPRRCLLGDRHRHDRRVRRHHPSHPARAVLRRPHDDRWIRDSRRPDRDRRGRDLQRDPDRPRHPLPIVRTARPPARRHLLRPLRGTALTAGQCR